MVDILSKAVDEGEMHHLHLCATLIYQLLRYDNAIGNDDSEVSLMACRRVVQVY